MSAYTTAMAELLDDWWEQTNGVVSFEEWREGDFDPPEEE